MVRVMDAYVAPCAMLHAACKLLAACWKETLGRAPHIGLSFHKDHLPWIPDQS